MPVIVISDREGAENDKKGKRGRSCVIVFCYRAVVVADDNLPRHDHFGASHPRGNEDSFIRCPCLSIEIPPRT